MYNGARTFQGVGGQLWYLRKKPPPKKAYSEKAFLKQNQNIKNAEKRSRQHARIQQRSSSTEGRLPPKVIFHQRASSTEGGLPPKVIFHLRSSSTKGCLPPKVIFLQRSSSINHNTLVDLLFVRAVNIPNLSLLVRSL